MMCLILILIVAAGTAIAAGAAPIASGERSSRERHWRIRTAASTSPRVSLTIGRAETATGTESPANRELVVGTSLERR